MTITTVLPLRDARSLSLCIYLLLLLLLLFVLYLDSVFVFSALPRSNTHNLRNVDVSQTLTEWSAPPLINMSRLSDMHMTALACDFMVEQLRKD